MSRIILSEVEKEVVKTLNHPIVTVKFLEEWLNRTETNYDGKNAIAADMAAMASGYYAAVQQIVGVVFPEFKDLTDQRFGNLIVIGGRRENDKGQREWRCACARRDGAELCVNTLWVKQEDLLNGKVLDCGCHEPKNEVKEMKETASVFVDEVQDVLEGTFSGGGFLSSNKMES